MDKSMGPESQGDCGSARFLLVRPDHIGDLLLTTPALYALRQGRPDAHISVLAGSWSARLLRGNPDVDEVVVCDLPWLARNYPSGWGAMFSKILSLRGRRYDYLVNFRIAAKEAAFVRVCGGEQRWGFDVPKSRWAWTDTVAYDRSRHVVDNYMNLVEALGAVNMDPQFRVFPEVADLAAVDALVAGNMPVVLGVTAGGESSKLWYAERWAEVGDYVASAGFPVIVSGGPGDESSVEDVRRRMQANAEGVVGCLDLLQFGGLLQRCFCLIAVDSFPMHLAAALGAPLIALIGADTCRQWGPYPTGSPCVVLQPPARIPRENWRMEQISADRVVGEFDALRARLESSASY